MHGAVNLSFRSRLAVAAAVLTALGACSPAGATPLTASGSTLAAGSLVSSSWPTVRPGTESNDVAALQLLLRAKGWLVPVDGRYTATTVAAVRKAQARRGLPVDGVAGPATWRYLIETVGGERRASGEATLAVRLLLLGAAAPATPSALTDFLREAPRSVDRGAVRDLQRASGVSVDGVVGPVTWRLLVANPVNRANRASSSRSVVVLRGDGLDVVTGTSTKRLRFGSSATAARSAVTAALGPLRTTALPECGQGPRASSSNGAFGLLVNDRTFVGWTDQGRVGRRLTTARGVGVGSTLAAVRRAHGTVRVTTSSLGPEFEVNGLSGLLTGRAAGNTVTVLSGGETCFFR